MRRLLFLLAPRWLALHAVVLASAVTMVLLGRWQWHVAHVRHGDVQNYAYAFQWWAFTVFALLMWLRVLRDAVPRTLAAPAATGEGPAAEVAIPEATGPEATGPEATVSEPAASEPQTVAYRRYVMPRARPDTDDPELGAYNDYLANLNRNSHDQHREDA